MSAMPGMPPDIGAILGGAPAAVDPMAAIAPPVPGAFPSVDPSVLEMLMGQIDDMQAQDIMALQEQQKSTLMQALMSRMMNAPNPLGAAAVASPGLPAPPSDTLPV